MASKCSKTQMHKEKQTMFTMESLVKLGLSIMRRELLFHKIKFPSSKKRSKKKLDKKTSLRQDLTLLEWLEILNCILSIKVRTMPILFL